jgi:hypothetical protein
MLHCGQVLEGRYQIGLQSGRMSVVKLGSDYLKALR